MTATLAVRPDQRPTVRACLTTIRVVPAPRSEPPTDEELRARGSRRRPCAPACSRSTCPDPCSRAGRGTGRPDRPIALEVVGPDTSSAPAPSPARAAARLFLATCVEVIGGFRPMSQLRPLCLPDRFTDIADRLADPPGHLARRPDPDPRPTGRYRSPVPGRTTGAPPRVAGATRPRRATGPAVRRVQICDIGPAVAEVAAVLGRRDIVWAMALRFEHRRGRWLCTLVEVI